MFCKTIISIDARQQNMASILAMNLVVQFSKFFYHLLLLKVKLLEKTYPISGCVTLLVNPAI